MYAYFKKRENESINILLVSPDANGLLTKVIHSSYITEANKEVIGTANSLEKRGAYLKLIPRRKLRSESMPKRMELHLHLHIFPAGATLKATMLHGWKVKYLSELGKRKCESGEFVVKTLPVVKMGWQLLLGVDLDK